MFILQLKNKLAIYDRYCEHRINGLKAIFLLELLFLFNYVYSVPNPFFYFFFVPMSAFAAEIAGTNLSEKYLFLFFTIMGSTLAIFLFGILSVYKIFFIFFVFAYSLWIYFTAIYKLKSMFVPAPLILSIAIYSLIYDNSNSNFYVALNHSLETLAAMLVVFVGLAMFPKLYYLTIWRRAFCEVLNDLENLSNQIYQNNLTIMPIIPGTIIMERYSKMLSPRVRYFSVLKITMLTFALVAALSYMLAFREQLRLNCIELFHSYVKRLRHACCAKEILFLTPLDISELQETYELRALHKLILSWNYLCQGS